MRRRSKLFDRIFSILKTAGLPNTVGRAAYVTNRILNGDGEVQSPGLNADNPNDSSGYIERAIIAFAHKVQPATAIRWKNHLNSGGSLKSLSYGSAGRRPRNKWTETERQGKGRRYWFAVLDDAVLFLGDKRGNGYNAVRDGLTVWVPYAKGMNAAVREQLAGKDPE